MPAVSAIRSTVRAEAGALVDELVEGPQVRCSAPLAVNLHQLDDGRVAAHLVSYDHDDEADRVRTLTDVRLDVIPRCGHFIPVERPDAVVRAIRSHLD